MIPETCVVAPAASAGAGPEVVPERAECADVARPPTPEQVQAAEAYFAGQQQESNAVVGLLGIWTSTLLLRDLALEHFATTQEKERDCKPEAKHDPDAQAD